jgi:hypothetical protein
MPGLASIFAGASASLSLHMSAALLAVSALNTSAELQHFLCRRSYELGSIDDDVGVGQHALLENAALQSGAGTTQFPSDC